MRNQVGWQNPLPQGNTIIGLKVFDLNNAIYCSSGNILKTSNGGSNWELIYTGYPTYNSSFYMVDQSIGYIALDSTKLVKTTNGGASWFLSSQFPVPLWYYPQIYFLNTNTGFVWGGNRINFSSSTKLFRTTNGGASWTGIISDTNYRLVKMHFFNTTSGYAIGNYYYGFGSSYHFKFLKTTNAGNNWDSIATNRMFEPSSLYFINSLTGFVSGRDSLGYYKAMRTTDGGQTWLLNINSRAVQFQFLDQNIGYYSNGNFYKTTNSGLNWSQINNTSTEYGPFYFLDQTNAYASRGFGFITKTLNGGVNWINLSTNFADGWLWDIRFSDANTGFSATTGGRILKTTNGGTNWNVIQLANNLSLSEVANVNSDLWFITEDYNGKILKTTTTGLTWDTLYTNLYAPTRLEFINAQTGFGVCKYNYFFKTTNGGQNWYVNNSLNFGQNWSMDFIDENTGFAGGTKTWKTTNGGLNWDSISFGQSYYSADIQFVNSTTGFIAANRRYNYNNNTYVGIVLKTTNTGLTWNEITIPNTSIDDIYFVNERIGYALGYDLFKTTNSGNSWFQLCTSNYSNTPTVSYFTDSLTGYIVGQEGMIIKTTTGGGNPIGIQPISNEIPKDFSLYQNYPNPFNPSSKIKFQISKLSDTKLIVYDILGREAATLVNEQLQPGTYEAVFDGSNFASGVYFYTLETDGVSMETKKMVLIK